MRSLGFEDGIDIDVGYDKNRKYAMWYLFEDLPLETVVSIVKSTAIFTLGTPDMKIFLDEMSVRICLLIQV